MINSQWPELPMFRTSFHGPKDVLTFEVRHCEHIYLQKFLLVLFVQMMYYAGMRLYVCCSQAVDYNGLMEGKQIIHFSFR